jgi:PAS domain S-box-containing protein
MTVDEGPESTRTARIRREAAADRSARDLAEAALRSSEARFRALLDSLQDSYALLAAVRDESGAIVDFQIDYANARLCELVQVPQDRITGKLQGELFPREIYGAPFDMYCEVVATGKPGMIEELIAGGEVDGREIQLALDVRAVKLGDGVVAIARDISERIQHEAEREELQLQLMRVYDFVIAASAEVVRSGTVQELFESVCRVAVEVGGFALAWIGLVDAAARMVRPVAVCGPASYLDGLHIALDPVSATGDGPTATSLRQRRPVICNELSSDSTFAPWRERAAAFGFGSSGSFPLIEADDAVGVLNVYMGEAGFFTDEETNLLAQLAADIRLAMRAREHETALAATRSFIETLTDSMVEGMFAIDAAGNLTFLNRAGEEMLGWTEAELHGRFMHDIVHHTREDGSPYPADECALLLSIATGTGIDGEEDVFIRKDGTFIPVNYSASPIHDDPAGGAVVVFTDISDRRHAETRRRREFEELTWVGRIRDALDEDRLTLFAQPIIDVRTREVVSHELLVRMIDHRGDLVPPGLFLPAAERFGLIGEIDMWVVQQAARLAADGHRVHFNLSGDSLGRLDPVVMIARTIAGAGAVKDAITCEITETALASEPEVAEASVRRIANSGAAIALDDFGTGYGGFAQLKRLPVRELKIDMEFVRNLADSVQNQHVVKAIVNLAIGLDKKTVAEGIEDEATIELLAAYGVDYGQGYGIGRPRPIGEVFARRDVRAPSS